MLGCINGVSATRELAATLATHSNSISIGLVYGFSAVLLPQLEYEDSFIKITYDQQAWIASLNVIATVLGALLAGALMDLIGRKWTIVLSSFPNLIGFLVIAFANNVDLLYVGRFVTGFSSGMGASYYVYCSEISSPANRGLFTSFGPIMVSLGLLIVYSLGYLLPWTEVAAVCASFALLSILVMMPMPETPSWLASKGQVDKATASLAWLRGDQEKADKELAEVLEAIKSRDNSRKGISQCCHLLTDPAVVKPFIILLALFVLQQGSGLYIIMYYAVNFFDHVGSSIDSFLVCIIVGVIRLIMSMVGSYLILKFDRKTLLIFSGVGMSLSMTVSGVYETLYGLLPVEERPLVWAPLVCIILNICLSMCGVYQIPWMLVGELLPLAARGVMGGVTIAVGNLFIFFTVLVYPTMVLTIGLNFTLWLFGFFSLTGSLFTYFCLLETRGKSLVDIERHFQTAIEVKKDNFNINYGCDIEDEAPSRKTKTTHL